MTFYTGTPQNSKTKLVRLLQEMQHRRTRVWEHPRFDRVDPVHIKDSKHYRERAGDLNRFLGQGEEDYTFDRFAIELMARGWGVIWNRGYRDHDKHLHVETIAWLSENYRGRVKLKAKRARQMLAVDGKLGPLTVSELQRAFGTHVDGEFSWGGQLGKAIQASINTEMNLGLNIDGKIGQKSVNGLSRMLGLGSSSASRMTMVQAREIQRRLNAHGHIFRNA